mgnify:FL=1
MNFMLIGFLVFLSSCNNDEDRFKPSQDSEFTEEEQYLIYRCDSAIKHQLLEIRALDDSIRDAHNCNDADKAAAAQYNLLFVTDAFWDDFLSTFLPTMALSHEFDSMEVWFPEVDAILKRHYFVEEIVHN